MIRKITVRILIGFLMGTIHSCSDAYITKGETWCKWDSTYQRYQYVYCLSDVHLVQDHLGHTIAKDKISKAQFDTFLSTVDKQKSYFIIEDPLTYDGNHHGYIQLSEYVKKSGSPLPFLCGLVNDCKQKGYDAVNAECRHIKVSGVDIMTVLDQVLLQQAPYSLKKSTINALQDSFTKYSLDGLSIYNEYQEAIKEIKQYNDNAILNEYYQHVLREVEQECSAVMQKIAKTGFVEFCNDLSSKNIAAKFLFSSHFVLSGFELLDVRALHALYNVPHKEHVFIIMGLVHILGISSMLEKFGYQKIDTHDMTSLSAEYVNAYYNEIQVVRDLNCFMDAELDVTELMNKYYQILLANQYLLDTQVLPDSYWQTCIKSENIKNAA